MEQEKIKCPICDSENCIDFVVDLSSCNECGHIFKKKSNNYKYVRTYQPHLFSRPIDEIRTRLEKVKQNQIVDMIFPCMLFFAHEVQPSDFYKWEYNQFFSQPSIMVMLNRVGIELIRQINVWDGKMCKTHIIGYKK